VIARVGIQETQELRPGYEVYNLVNTGKGECILWVHQSDFLSSSHSSWVHSPFPILLGYINQIFYPIRVLNLFNEASS
jgi:hypothetical protein